MGKLVMIILTKSSKFSAKCVAGINVENGEWVRLVSDDVNMGLFLIINCRQIQGKYVY